MSIDRKSAVAWRVVRALCGTVSLFVVSFLVGRALFSRSDENAAVADASMAIADRRPGRQLVLVYVGSSRCGPSNAPHVATDVRAARELLREQALREGMGFVSIGVAREMDPQAGLQHLENIGGFNEIAAGQSELNQASAHFISRDHVGIAATPQVIILERTLVAEGSGVNPSSVHEVVLTRKVGRREIENWVSSGARVPYVRRGTEPARSGHIDSEAVPLPP